MATKTHSVFTLGTIISAELAKRVCDKLDIACEIAAGNFSWSHDGNCTQFTAPRQLGTVNYRIAQAIIDGLRIGLFY
jgi:hypothetical protein